MIVQRRTCDVALNNLFLWDSQKKPNSGLRASITPSPDAYKNSWCLVLFSSRLLIHSLLTDHQTILKMTQTGHLVKYHVYSPEVFCHGLVITFKTCFNRSNTLLRRRVQVKGIFWKWSVPFLSVIWSQLSGVLKSFLTQWWMQNGKYVGMEKTKLLNPMIHSGCWPPYK